MSSSSGIWSPVWLASSGIRAAICSGMWENAPVLMKLPKTARPCSSASEVGVPGATFKIQPKAALKRFELNAEEARELLPFIAPCAG